MTYACYPYCMVPTVVRYPYSATVVVAVFRPSAAAASALSRGPWAHWLLWANDAPWAYGLLGPRVPPVPYGPMWNGPMGPSRRPPADGRQSGPIGLMGPMRPCGASGSHEAQGSRGPKRPKEPMELNEPMGPLGPKGPLAP